MYNAATVDSGVGIPVLRLRAVWRLTAAVTVNGFWGAQLRSLLGVSLRESCCPCPTRDCAACLLRYDCPYAIAYHGCCRTGGGTPAPALPYIMRYDPLLPEFIPRGGIVRSELMLLGELALRPAVWVQALVRMGERGFKRGGPPAPLQAVAQACGRKARLIWTPGVTALPACTPDYVLPQLLPQPELLPVNLRLRFLTQVRLRHDGVEPARPTYTLLLCALRRRLGALCHSWGPSPRALPLVGARPRVVRHDWRRVEQQRWSSSQEQRIPVDGWIGELKLRGVSAQELVWWEAGSLLGVGKNATFGLGRYEAEVVI